MRLPTLYFVCRVFHSCVAFLFLWAERSHMHSMDWNKKQKKKKQTFSIRLDYDYYIDSGQSGWVANSIMDKPHAHCIRAPSAVQYLDAIYITLIIQFKWLTSIFFFFVFFLHNNLFSIFLYLYYILLLLFMVLCVFCWLHILRQYHTTYIWIICSFSLCHV